MCASDCSVSANRKSVFGSRAGAGRNATYTNVVTTIRSGRVNLDKVTPRSGVVPVSFDTSRISPRRVGTNFVRTDGGTSVVDYS